MKKSALVFLMLPSLFLAGCGSGTYSGYADPQVDMHVRQIAVGGDIYNILNQARSAVVGIAVDMQSGYSIGSGVAVADGGYLLTNFHVVEGGNNITLYYADKTTGSGELLWADPSIDIAVVKSSRNIPYLATRNADNLLVGEEVYALGTPLTLQFKHTTTKGIISALDRTLESESAYGTSFLQSLIQHDASINPGNSGGALINSSGELIGINTLKATEGEGIGFAIPIELGKVIVDQIVLDKNYSVPYFGVFGFDSDIAMVYGESVEDLGVYVVDTAGPAATAGLAKGDILKSIDGEKISSILDLRIALYKKKAGEVINVAYQRAGVDRNVDITLTSRSNNEK